MEILRIVLSVIFVIVCIAAVILILSQEGKNQGLGSIAGGSETYWSKNKGRSEEATKARITIGLAVAFFVLAIVLNLNFG